MRVTITIFCTVVGFICGVGANVLVSYGVLQLYGKKVVALTDSYYQLQSKCNETERYYLEKLKGRKK